MGVEAQGDGPCSGESKQIQRHHAVHSDRDQSELPLHGWLPFMPVEAALTLQKPLRARHGHTFNISTQTDGGSLSSRPARAIQ